MKDLGKHNLLILGAGQYGTFAKEIAEAMDCFANIAFLDDSYEPSTSSSAHTRHPEERSDEGSSPALIGSTRDLEKFADKFHYAFVAIGNPDVRRRLVELVLANGMDLATVVHPTAYISPSAQLQKGVCVEPNATVQMAASVGLATFVASGAIVRHNAKVGDFCHIDCNAVVESVANVPASTYISCGSVFARVRD